MTGEQVPRLVAWELTNRCNLRCRHCRAADAGEAVPGELTHDEALALVDDMATFAPLTLILSGGEPLVREDFMDIVRAGVERKMRVAVATNGVLLTESLARKMKSAGVSRVSLSLDGPDAATHDAQRGLDGAYEMLMAAAARLREAELPFQINTTVTVKNADRLAEIVKLVPTLGAMEHHVFMFVPTGRGESIADESLGGRKYEEILSWLAEVQEANPVHIQVTCAPHYQRILRQTDCAPASSGGHPSEHPGGNAPSGHPKGRSRGGGCLGGTAFAFISAVGEVAPCGYLPLKAGNVRDGGFAKVWRESPLFLELRERENLTGRCGACEYRKVCGGCRARAYAVSGDHLGEEPYCTYVPRRAREGEE
jgi:heme b synthase